jgi:hypothetical protein
VITLRIFEVDEQDIATDITANYEATFMLYASLEHARPMAKGRQMEPHQSPVLAGVTVASAAYLEKAAFFIFPDLSVRHEGLYRLRFSLFEGVKRNDDFDLGTNLDDGGSEPVRREDVFNRLDVVTEGFQVYSAKKFPGLDTSTLLSIQLSEQGCRVRIRKDVRQRRGTKVQKTEPSGDVGSSYQGTPQASYQPADHSRSASRNSFGSQYERREPASSSLPGPSSGYPSRQLSTSSSYTQMLSPAPITPTSAMPPPSFPQYNPPQPPTYTSGYHPLPPLNPHVGGFAQLPQPAMRDPGFPPHSGQLTLPPLNSSMPRQPESRPTYPQQQPMVAKRSHTSSDYHDEYSLKQGARPDTMPQHLPQYTAGSHGFEFGEPLEADENEDDGHDLESNAYLHEGPMLYLDRYGSRNKCAHPLPRRQ